LKYDSVVLLIHEGLGDLAAMSYAIKNLAEEHKVVYIVTRKNYFKAISLIFKFSDNIKNIPALEGKLKCYGISRKRQKVFARYGHLIKVGIYDYDPLFGYPDSFYLKLGCSPSLATRKIYFDFSVDANILVNNFLKHIDKKFVFISNGTSKGYMNTLNLNKIDSRLAIVIHSNDSGIKRTERVFDLALLNKDDFTRSLLNSLYVSCLAEYAIVSDAGLFNILIRLENKSNLRVIWRRHPHSLNREIYGKYIKARF
jgi:hypothetical protein